MEKVEWKVEGMDCTNCALTISNYLKKEGLKEVKVNFIGGDVSFELDEAAKKETSDQEKEVKFQESLNQLIQRTSQVVEGLRAVELDAVVLNNQELIELFYNFYNPEKIEKETLNLPT